ncbi:sugar ABC transporter permease [Anaerocolumna sedimenticola]|uniref:Sugar ABC transporter permease n=1 Tax=Anaerocolumna sedimenticola TaxID=2696063 RepID=A0A6P1THM4_9FIRM|nr:sugar ABC transporter permease [Anaerocolumna sedimenticola]QHQ59933.1 sugar ABC transporter permease [Anaerocolumna sedimenticola]
MDKLIENKRTKKSRKTLKNYLYLLPAVLLTGLFFITSIFYTIYLSFNSWDGFSPIKFVGLDNYIYLFHDTNFKISVMNTLIWVVCSLLISLVIPLFFAILISRSSWLTGFKNIFYFPTALSATVGGMIIASMISTYGLPQIFGLLGMDSLVCDWLAIPYVNTFIMIGMGMWQGIGLNMILFISGLNHIPASPIEAASIEGAGTFSMYTKVIFPLLKPTTIVVFLMSLVNSFKIFDSIWVMTKGGPYRSSETLALTMYEESFIRNQFGVGSAVAVVLSVVILFLAYFNLKNTFSDNNLTV